MYSSRMPTDVHETIGVRQKRPRNKKNMPENNCCPAGTNTLHPNAKMTKYKSHIARYLKF